MAGAFSLALAACGGDTARKAATVAPAGSDLGAVEHVIFLMNENRSFDHYFGSYKGVRGFDDSVARAQGVFAQSWPGGAAQQLLPFHLDTANTDAECTFDLSHEWSAQHTCWNGGKMDQFVATHTLPQWEGPQNGVLTMGYYTRSDLAFWYSLADAFTIGDGYHCSVMGPTHPNRLHALSGTLDPEGHEGGPVIITNSSSSAIGSASWRSMPEELEAKGVSWKVYNPSGASLPTVEPVVDRHLRQHPSVLQAPRAGPVVTAVQEGLRPDLPPRLRPRRGQRHLASGLVDHPAVGVRRASALSARQRGCGSPIRCSVPWCRTPRPGPRPCCSSCTTRTTDSSTTSRRPWPRRGLRGSILSVDPLPSPAKGVAGPLGLGFRVPLLVVSPFSRGGYVCSDTFDHTSQLRFLETRFGVKAPNSRRGDEA